MDVDDLVNSLHPSPSTVQSPALPWEVIERAINLCAGDNATLRTIALTCSQLHPRSLFVLFTNVDIQSKEKLIQFYDAVQARSHLQPVVRSLSFPWGDFPSPLLSILPSLRRVTFDRISMLIEDNNQLPQSTLSPGGQFATSLRSLTIRPASFQMEAIFLRFLSAFRTSKALPASVSHYTNIFLWRNTICPVEYRRKYLMSR
ncbi:hypothetical protein DICSQDRAFT_173977 [Dichomitus squalens LYAD-421 SS1]|uniref:Uncharacterized protein n=1 Tax=Dichomitus squalens (strain LYAD-421) TaxID=732165 RepID=R7SMQ7_DICSQ|nr:uncharacterized protein DICSQDRAFT_173977 [Dichomitus squalens LYAD-421 SS1]EJF57421.1 hypothetical protein DICSQDRAFT_173977 [Dichomitus squalens LYAD-421 SS1]